MASKDDILLEEQIARRPMTKALFRRLISYVRPYRRTFVLNLIFTLLSTVSGLLGPKFIQIGVDRYLTGVSSTEAASHGILIVSVIFLGNLLLGWFLSVAQVKSAITIGQGAMNDLRLEVFRHIQKLSLNYFDRTHQGRIISRADTDIDALDRILTWGATQMLSSALTLVGVIFLLVQYDYRLCLAVSLVVPPLFLATRLFHHFGMKAYREVRKQTSRITASLAESIAGVRVVQAFSREEENLNRFREVQGDYVVEALVASRVFHTYMPFIGLMSGVGALIILGYGGQLVTRHEITVGQLAAFILYFGMFFGPIQTMGDLFNSVLSTAASAERIFQLLDTEPQVHNRPGAVALPPLNGEVVFDHIHFRYDSTPADTWILKDITFTARPGETIALVGATGSGKTSIVSLIARFYEPQQGRILIDGHEAAQTTLESLRRQIGIVTQENFLFTGTIMENLKFGRPGATDDEAIQAAKNLGAHDIIQGFERGYQTTVAERGSNFSAGERQLVCLVRAMIAEPRILILDEATSAVDPQTERLIQQALEKLFARRTSFVVAHRLSTVRHANLILVLSHGEIIERGTHDQLIAAGGHYAKLYEEFVRR